MTVEEAVALIAERIANGGGKKVKRGGEGASKSQSQSRAEGEGCCDV